MSEWKESEEKLYSMLLEETKDVWYSSPDREFVAKIASRLAEYQYKLAKAEEEGNANAIKIYKQNLSYVTADFDSEMQELSSRFSSGGAKLLTKIINKVLKEIILKAVSPSLEDLPLEEKILLKKEISEVFDSAISKKEEISKEKIMAKLEVEEVAQKLEPIVVKITTTGDYYSGAMEGVMFLMGLVNNVKEMTGSEKKQFVIEAFVYAYKKFDPDIPWLEGYSEDFVESYMLKQLLPAAVEAIYKASQGDVLPKIEA